MPSHRFDDQLLRANLATHLGSLNLEPSMNRDRDRCLPIQIFCEIGTAFGTAAASRASLPRSVQLTRQDQPGAVESQAVLGLGRLTCCHERWRSLHAHLWARHAFLKISVCMCSMKLYVLSNQVLLAFLRRVHTCIQIVLMAMPSR